MSEAKSIQALRAEILNLTNKVRRLRNNVRYVTANLTRKRNRLVVLEKKVEFVKSELVRLNPLLRSRVKGRKDQKKRASQMLIHLLSKSAHAVFCDPLVDGTCYTAQTIDYYAKQDKRAL